MLRAASASLLVAGQVLAASAAAAAAANVSSASASSSSSSSSPGNASSTEPHAANSSAAFANIDDGGGIDPRDFAQGYTDVQTLMLAGVCTLIVLVFALGAGFAVRIAWRKLRERAADGYTGVVHRDDSSDPLGSGSGGGGGAGRSHNTASSLSSGNLLADEVRLQDGATKTTTTTFTTSASPEHEPVFVVEVTQPRGYSALPACAEVDNPGGGGCAPEAANGEGASSQRAQVHRADAADDDEDAGAAAAPEAAPGAAAWAARRSNTGLSQSDLSVSSAGSSNPSYRYGNQLAYDGGPFGYPQYAGYCVEPPPHGPGAAVAAAAAAAPSADPLAAGAGEAEAASATPGSARRPVFWGGQDSMLSSDQQSERLLSDILQEEMLQEEQRQLGNGQDSAAPRPRPQHQHAALHRTGSLPPRVRGDPAQEQQAEGEAAEAALSAGARLEPVAEAVHPAAHSPRKRASLPAISAGLCGPSPRLEGLRNDISPLREVADRSPEAQQCAGRRTLGGGVGDKTFENESFVPTDKTAS